MFIVLKNNKRSFRRTFTSYDAARCAVRKHIRKTNPAYTPVLDAYSNPNLSAFGYSIKAV